MRELFDEVAGKSPIDPREASRQSSRAQLRKRFYASAGVGEGVGGFTILLDGKPIRTPGRNVVAIPKRSLAEAVAVEWDRQVDVIDPLTMPLTRLANSAIDGVSANCAAVAADIAKYFETDLLFYRAGFPEALVARQSKHWDPVLRWAADEFGAHFILAEGIIHVSQPETALAAARAALPDDPWRLAALHVVTTLTGSALLALALQQGVLDADAVWTAAHVDEDWNSQSWGLDEEVAAKRAARSKDFEAAAGVLRAFF